MKFGRENVANDIHTKRTLGSDRLIHFQWLTLSSLVDCHHSEEIVGFFLEVYSTKFSNSGLHLTHFRPAAILDILFFYDIASKW